MKKILSFLLTFLLYYGAQSQTLKGEVKSRAGQSLVNSTVMLLDTKDSSMLAFAKSKENGLFEIKAPKKDEAILQVSNVGFEKFMLYLALTGADQNLGTIYMDSATVELSELVVKGERAAVEINKDTVEFNAGSFKVAENAMTEDLLKKLPGVTVDRDGTVTAQGKTVTRVLVDGKEFFGKDPKMSTKNIPANAIAKVQVFDKKSDRAEFTGIDDGEEETTINLKLRDDKKNLGFGKITTGAGVDGNDKARYNLLGNYFSFKNGNQLSFIGNINNINQQNFGGGGFGGGGIRFGGFGGGGGVASGLTRNLSGGVNFNNKITTKTELNGSYNYTNTNTFTESSGTSQSVIGSIETAGQSASEQTNGGDSHRLNVTMNSKINPRNTIRWVNRLDYRNNDSNSASEDEEAMKNTGQIRNSSERVSTSEGNSLGYSSQALYQMAFDKKGRTLTANLTLGINDNNSNGTLLSKNGLFDVATNNLKYTLLNQVNDQVSQKLNYGAEISFTEPLNLNNFLEFNYSYQKVNNDLDKKVYNVLETGNKLDSTLSNKYENDYIYNKAGISYRASFEKWNGNFGAAIQDSRLVGNLILRNQLIEKRFTNPVFNGRVRYSFTSSKTMDLNYNSNISEPSMTQLSPVPDNSNPLNIYVGNPNLKPQYAQRLNLNFRNFNQLTFTNFFMTVGVNYTKDNITDSVTYDNETLAKIRKPINYGNNVGANIIGNYGFRIKPISTRFSIMSMFNLSRSQTLINNVDNITNTLVNTNTLRADFNPNDNLTLGLSARISFNKTSYSQNNQLNPNYVNQGYTADLEWIVPQTVTFSSSLDYSIYRYATRSDVQSVPLWNFSAYRTVLKNKRGEIRLSLNDILGKSQVISQTATGNTFSEQRSNALGRYFLLSFTYNINGGIPQNMRMGRAMRM